MGDERTTIDDNPVTEPAPDAADVVETGAVDVVDAAAWTSWARLWQVPTILVCLGLIGLGLVLAGREAPENDFAGALDQVDRMIAAGELESARQQLRDGIEPHLDDADDVIRGRFLATVADWLDERQRAHGARSPETDEIIADHYRRADAAGFELDPTRHERWAHAALALGDEETARARLQHLEAMSLVDGADPALRTRRNRLLRRIIEHGLHRDDRDLDTLLETLAIYRDDPMLQVEDRLWAIAREAEARIRAGHFTEAVDHLLVAARRLEAQAPADGYGEIEALLGRAYFHLGDLSRARFHLGRAETLLPPADDVRADVHLVRGRIALAVDDPAAALADFDEVVREYPATAAWPAALLGRAEAHGLLGEHDASLVDYGRLAEALAGAASADVDPEDVARSLIDRHDAALARGRLDLALDYLVITERLVPRGGLPPEVLSRLAATNRQMAENLMPPPEFGADEADVDPAVRGRAIEHYRRAARFAVRHLRAIAGRPDADETWAQSLWLAADSFDLGGEPAEAAEHFDEYVEGRPTTDPRRPAALLRLGHARRALLEHEPAAAAYERLIREHPRTIEATRAHVPLARTLVALERPAEAITLLEGLLAGTGVVEPEAVDYRDALVELGAIQHEQGRWTAAVERLQEAVDRYPFFDRRGEALYRLADARGQLAHGIDERLDADPTIPVAERRELERRRASLLESAQAGFAAARETLDARGRDHLDHLQRDMLRWAWLAEADCAYERGDWPTAIERYEAAARAYPDHLASLHAMVQIVNAWSELGEAERAEAAHRRAVARLQQLPDRAFDAADAVMDRAAWERWLMNHPLGAMRAASALP